MIFIEFTSKCAGKVYPYARIKQRKHIKSPEGLTKSVRYGLPALSNQRILYNIHQVDRLQLAGGTSRRQILYKNRVGRNI